MARPPDRLASNRVNRGGIQKRSSTPVKVDKDGDLDMGAADSNNKIMRTSRGGRGAAIRGSSQTSRAAQSGQSDSRTKARSTRSALDTAAVQKAVFNELGLKDAGQGARSSRPPGNAHRHRDSLEKVSVWGLKQSKAASNEDGGLRDLVAFLERKATRGAEEPLRIKKVCLTLNIVGRHRLHSYGRVSGPLSFRNIDLERRPSYSATALG